MSHCSSYALKITLADSHTSEVMITAPDLIAASNEELAFNVDIGECGPTLCGRIKGSEMI